MNARLSEDAPTARCLRVTGHVQGVGFRPYVYRLARELGLTGSVQNLNGDVEILVQGDRSRVERFAQELTGRAPAIARPHIAASNLAPLALREDFLILDSAASGRARVYVPPDYFTCEDCLAELAHEGDRRYRYPFINCTQCGPRYTLITALPYDRSNTTMVGFELCPQCRREYENPHERRFHAEPVACPACGPQVWLEEDQQTARGEAALERVISLLHSGATVAVRGVGGYHLLCDATSELAVSRLRTRKHRPHKPLAVMFPDLDNARAEVDLTPAATLALTGAARPIVLLTRRPGGTLPANIAPGLNELGVLLPYSPLHHLLLSAFGRPVIATSGNISGEPVLTEPADARVALTGVADASLHHDRPIARPADDSVVRIAHGKPTVLRLGRGTAPCELSLPWTLDRPLLATGGHLKNTIALAWDNRVVLSPHIADMGSVRGEAVFTQLIADLQRLYGITAAEVVCDAHPDYATTRWASRCGLPVTRVLHHHAHAAALAAEAGSPEPMLVFTWDGVGFGADRTLWGGETFAGQPGSWRRVASLRPFRLPGGERAGRAPWRSAAALCWELGTELPRKVADPLARAAWNSRLNCPETSSVGRLFDAAAALLLGLDETSFEGQGPMMLEAAAAGTRVPGVALPTYRDASGLMRIDWEPLLAALIEAAPGTAALFHSTLAAAIVSIARAQRESTGINIVGLTGGVFQNALLTELAHDLLTEAGFRVCLAERIPCGDGGLSYGQIIEAGCVGRTAEP